jgi:hypothetical protein
MQRHNSKLATISVGVFCALLLCLALSTGLSAQNGITATQVAGTTTGAGSGVDAMWADNTDKRWKMNNNNTGAQDVAAWACPTALGGIMYAGAAVSGVDAESCLSLGAVGIPLLAGSSAPQWGGSSTYLDLQQNALVTEFTNNSSGTTAGLLVIFVTSSGASQVETALTTTTQGVEGICVAGCSTSGTAQIARAGIASCQFDGSTTAGDYVQISTTAGKCHDTLSSTYPTNGQQVIGRVITNQTGSGTYAMLLYPDSIVPPTPTTTVGYSGVWANGSPLGMPSTSTTVTPTNTTMFFVQLNLTAAQVIGHFTVDVTGAGTGETWYTCLYNSGGTSLLWSANATVNATNAVSGSASQYTAVAGSYLLAWEQTGTTAATVQGTSLSNPAANILNQNGSRIGTTANKVSGSACPATTGALTQASEALPLLALEP